MLEYLSSELTDSATVARARDMMTDDAEETSEEIRQKEQEHIFAEIVKVNIFYHLSRHMIFSLQSNINVIYDSGNSEHC